MLSLCFSLHLFVVILFVQNTIYAIILSFLEHFLTKKFRFGDTKCFLIVSTLFVSASFTQKYNLNTCTNWKRVPHSKTGRYISCQNWLCTCMEFSATIYGFRLLQHQQRFLCYFLTYFLPAFITLKRR